MKTLEKLKGFGGIRPVVTIVMDGVGIAPETFKLFESFHVLSSSLY